MEKLDDELRRRATDGDTEAALRLGGRLLVGDGGVFAPDEGADWVGRAARQGSAAASCLLATLAAAGIGRPQSWSEALDHLARAAALGDVRARGQLAVLAPAAGDGGGEAAWDRRARDIDLEAWLAPAPRQALCEAPRVRTVERLIAPAVCDWLVEAARGRLARATMYNPVSGRDEPHPRRTNSAFLFDVLKADVVVALVRARAAATVKIPLFCFEPTQVFHYATGQEIGPHFDYLEHRTMTVYGTAEPYDGQRIATFLIYLNDDFEGGETVFPKVDVRFKGAKGDAIFFANVDPEGRPDPLSLHAGAPPRRGEKWIISQWIHNRPFTGALA
jgi:hypothetical protein